MMREKRRDLRAVRSMERSEQGKAKLNQRNIVLTGPGRSGTTLTCYLLNKLPNTVALSEPISPGKFADRLPDYEAVCDGIEDFYFRMRKMALRKGAVLTKHVGGRVPDNTKGIKDRVRQRIAETGKIEVGKDLSLDFYLAIKQPGLFTALLPSLAKRFPSYAIVRNPIAIVASSSTLQKVDQRPDHDRTPPAKVRYDAELRRQLQENRGKGADVLDLRVMWLHYAFERYVEELYVGHVIRYEDIVESRGKALSVIVPAASELDEPLENKILNPLYQRDKVLDFGEKLLASEGACWRLYSRRDVEEIMEALS
jgi:hypothetical protein